MLLGHRRLCERKLTSSSQYLVAASQPAFSRHPLTAVDNARQKWTANTDALRGHGSGGTSRTASSHHPYIDYYEGVRKATRSLWRRRRAGGSVMRDGSWETGSTSCYDDDDDNHDEQCPTSPAIKSANVGRLPVRQDHSRPHTPGPMPSSVFGQR